MLTVQTSNAPKGSATQKGVQFLKPEHVRAKSLVFTVAKVTTDKPDNFGNPYVVYFTCNGQRYSKGYSPTSTGLAELVSVMGTPDETKWAKKTVLIGASSSEDTGERLTYSAVK